MNTKSSWESLNTDNYYKYINTIIEARGQFNVPDTLYYEVHHIIPRAFGGQPEKISHTARHENLVWLAFAEHYTAHKILAEDNLSCYAAVAAYIFMSGKEKDQVVQTAEEFEIIKRTFIDLERKMRKGQPSPNKGKHYSAEERKKISERTKKVMQNSEIRKKISDSGKGRIPWNRGIPMRAETKQKQRDLRKGKQLPEDWKKHISEGQTGRLVSEETKYKISVAQAGEKSIHNKKIICLETNKIYFNIKAAAEELNINVSNIVQVCKGKRQTAGGLHFKHIEGVDTNC